MPSPFHVVEHIVEGQHIREYPRALVESQETVVHLHVKQYIPVDNPNPQPGDVTIIGAHANGFPKELYEPLWEDLLTQSHRHNFRIRSIWITDVATQGQSGVINESILGNDPNWNDHARDLLHLINTKRDLMPRPLVGIGHSMGGNQLCNVAYMHPRLFTTLVFIDPVIQKHASVPKEQGPNIAQLSTFRRDHWPSRSFAAKSFASSPFYKKWDPRVLDRWIKHGLRDLPTALYPLDPNETASSTEAPVTLMTSKHMEVFQFLRPNYSGYGDNGKAIDRSTHADLNPTMPNIAPFYRAEGPQAFTRLHELRPPVLYIFGELSDVNSKFSRDSKLENTGIGVGGSGGVVEGKVKGLTYEGIGHLIAMEAVERTAEDSASWIATEVGKWRQEEEAYVRDWVKGRSRVQKQTVDEEWKKMMGGPPTRPKKKEGKL